MSATVITGYTGTRHITPAMDASIYRSIYGDDSYIVNEGDLCAGEMPSINEFDISSGIVAMQGHMIIVGAESLAISTCATGYKRIDLVCMRWNHDTDTLIDTAELVVIEGTAVQTGNDPVAPSYNEGTIDDGVTVVDFPMFEIDCNGSTVTFEQLADIVSVSNSSVTVNYAQMAYNNFFYAAILDDDGYEIYDDDYEPILGDWKYVLA